jgi:hypothetical protein
MKISACLACEVACSRLRQRVDGARDAGRRSKTFSKCNDLEGFCFVRGAYVSRFTIFRHTQTYPQRCMRSAMTCVDEFRHRPVISR